MTFTLQGRFLSSLNTQSPALNVVSRRLLRNLVKIMIHLTYLVTEFVWFVKPSSTFAWGWEFILFNFSKLHGLIACGGEDGAVECFDMRMRSSAARINAVAPAGDADQVSLSLSCWHVFCMFLLWELPSWDCISWEPKGLDSSMLHDFDKDYRSSICFKPVYILKVLFSIPFGKFYGSSAASISPYS